MPLQKLQFRPGVNREGTTLANEGGWYDCDKIRFRSGFPEKIGGWAVISYNTFLGYCRSLWNWITLKGFNLLGVGTNLKFYVENGGEYFDITPLRETNSNPSNQITLAVANGSSLLTITDNNAESLQVNDFVTLDGATTLGGNVTSTVLDQEYVIANVLSGTSYTVYLRAAGTSVAGVNFTVNLATSFLTFPNGTSPTNGDKVILLSTISPPTGLATGTIYYVVNASGASCQLSTTLGGSPISITSEGAPNQAVYFLLTSSATASSSTMTGLTIAYQINTGFPIYTVGTGWSTGPWAPYLTTTLTNPFATTNGSSTITVTQTSHGLSNGEYVYFSSISDTDVSGISNTVLQKSFQVSNVTTNTYDISTVIGQAPGPVITYTANATSSSQGGTVVVYYPSATITASTTRGWGTGFSTGIGFQLRLWSQSNYGEDLLFSPRGGALYLWQPGTGSAPAFNTRGALVSGTNVPSKINEIMVSDSTRITIAFGCDDYGTYGLNDQDPMLVRWTAQEDYTDWTPTATNQAGSYRLSHGSVIVGALQTRQEINIWTDAAIYSMQYLGPPFVWGFTLLADNISVASQNAMTTASGVVYWMGVDKFYVYSGRVETLPCAVRTYIFNDINRDQLTQVQAGTNEGYSEVWWFYCSANSDIVDRYVIYNYLDRVWYYGSIDRTAWLDSALRPFPIGASTGNLLVYHESAVDDGTTNPPSPISCYIQSSDFDIGDGHNYGFVWRLIPDITFDGSTTSLPNYPLTTFTMRPRQNPGSGYSTAYPDSVQSTQNYAGQQTYNVQQFTEIIYTRARGRQMAFKVSSDTLGTQWQLGTPRIDVRPDGRQ